MLETKIQKYFAVIKIHFTVVPINVLNILIAFFSSQNDREFRIVIVEEAH